MAVLLGIIIERLDRVVIMYPERNKKALRKHTFLLLFTQRNIIFRFGS
jgi:hypothetical protein